MLNELKVNIDKISMYKRRYLCKPNLSQSQYTFLLFQFKSLLNQNLFKMKKLIVLSFVLLTIVSCSKKESTVNPPLPTVPDPATKYYPLDIGNYWVYENVMIDTLGDETIDEFIDSLIVTRDTLINGNSYAVIEGVKKFAQQPNEWQVRHILRDSSGYMVDHTGGILFSANNFTDTLRIRVQLYNDDQDTLFISHYKMEKPEEKVIVKAGTFEVIWKSRL